jgi:hypothetical protein
MSVLSDQVIVITGVSEGIGRALNLAFATQKPFRKKIEEVVSCVSQSMAPGV